MRSIRMAALAVAITFMFSGLALARDHDHDKYDHDKHDRHDHYKRDHRNRDYRDRHDRNYGRDQNYWRDGDRDRDRNRERRDHEHHWWQRDHYRDDGYYHQGQIYNRAPESYSGQSAHFSDVVYRYPVAAYSDGGYAYPGGGGYDYPSPGYRRPGYGRNVAYGFAYQDGSYMARRDWERNKRFNPNPRNEYGNRTHGYDRSLGDKNYYRAEYTNGYLAGYEATYRGGRDSRY
jgi:hypothetical protein